jgi:hypothetical protein
MGDIGEIEKIVEIPLPIPEHIEDPTPAPIAVPEREPEKVPAGRSS